VLPGEIGPSWGRRAVGAVTRARAVEVAAGAGKRRRSVVSRQDSRAEPLRAPPDGPPRVAALFLGGRPELWSPSRQGRNSVSVGSVLQAEANEGRAELEPSGDRKGIGAVGDVTASLRDPGTSLRFQKV